MQINNFQQFKQQGKKISMVTCYDYTFAQILNSTAIDCILVGDSAAMTMHGYVNTINADVDMMKAHTMAVVKGAADKFVIADLPFLSYRKDLITNMNAIDVLMRTGANAVKLEGAAGNLNLIKHIIESGVPVMGHIGLTPQSVHQLGGFRVQGRDDAAQLVLRQQAKQLEQAGCFSIVLECVPDVLAQQITAEINIPTIGIGAGVHTDGQVLVLQDLLGLNPSFKPKFVKKYVNGFGFVQDAIEQFHQEVVASEFPDDSFSFGTKGGVKNNKDKDQKTKPKITILC